MLSREKAVQLSKCLRNTQTSLSVILEEARASFTEKPDDFVVKNYGVLGAAISCYSTLFQSTESLSRNDLEKKWSNYFSETCVREAVEDLFVIEEEWDFFLQEIDSFMNGEISSKTCHQSQLLNGGNVDAFPISLVNTSFASLNCSIHIVSFGSREGALKWLEETNCPFPMWTDTSRHFYQVLGFKRSMFQVWRVATMHFYGAQLAQNIPLPKPYTDYVDDPLQMAGNVLFDSKGTAILLHASQQPADRPDVESMLEILQNNIEK